MAGGVRTTVERIRAARDTVARLMVNEPRNARGFAPVFERLDCELTAAEAAQHSDPVIRARAIVAQSAMA